MTCIMRVTQSCAHCATMRRIDTTRILEISHDQRGETCLAVAHAGELYVCEYDEHRALECVSANITHNGCGYVIALRGGCADTWYYRFFSRVLDDVHMHIDAQGEHVVSDIDALRVWVDAVCIDAFGFVPPYRVYDIAYDIAQSD